MKKKRLTGVVIVEATVISFLYYLGWQVSIFLLAFLLLAILLALSVEWIFNPHS
jgi:hypothetical protein